MKAQEGDRKKRAVKPWHRRQAIQIAGMLPEDPDDARIVLAQACKLIEFVHRHPHHADVGEVVTLQDRR